ncbi:MAG: hypothetical protein [Bacteriophage sp.]|nr:MAG: hypothetical protein [Bacteriophage sp.]
MYDLPLIQKDIIEQHIKKHTKNHPDLPVEFGVAIYTDGGGHLGNVHMGIPNLGGYGVHGFVYANTPTTTGAGITGYTVSDLGYIVNQRLNQASELVDIYTQKLTKENAMNLLNTCAKHNSFGYC